MKKKHWLIRIIPYTAGFACVINISQVVTCPEAHYHGLRAVFFGLLASYYYFRLREGA